MTVIVPVPSTHFTQPRNPEPKPTGGSSGRASYVLDVEHQVMVFQIILENPTILTRENPREPIFPVAQGDNRIVLIFENLKEKAKTCNCRGEGEECDILRRTPSVVRKAILKFLSFVGRFEIRGSVWIFSLTEPSNLIQGVSYPDPMHRLWIQLNWPQLKHGEPHPFPFLLPADVRNNLPPVVADVAYVRPVLENPREDGRARTGATSLAVTKTGVATTTLAVSKTGVATTSKVGTLLASLDKIYLVFVTVGLLDVNREGSRDDWYRLLSGSGFDMMKSIIYCPIYLVALCIPFGDDGHAWVLSAGLIFVICFISCIWRFQK